MRRWLLIGIGLLALFGSGVGVGMFVEYKLHTGVAAAAQPYFDLVRGLSGEGGERGPAPPLEHWGYPEAKELQRGRGPSLVINGQTVKPPPEYQVLTTPDDYQKVAAHYATKLGFAGTSEYGRGGVTNMTSTEAGFLLALADGRESAPGINDRLVRVQCFRQSCSSYSAVAFITRTANEAETHVILLYDPK
jgi:hypothetical protein